MAGRGWWLEGGETGHGGLKRREWVGEWPIGKSY